RICRSWKVPKRPSVGLRAIRQLGCSEPSYAKRPSRGSGTSTWVGSPDNRQSRRGPGGNGGVVNGRSTLRLAVGSRAAKRARVECAWALIREGAERL